MMDPWQVVVVTNNSGQPLFASQLMALLHLENGGWVKSGCNSPGGVLRESPSGCDFQGGARVTIGPKQSISEDDSLPFGLDWPLGLPATPGTYAVIVAFGSGTAYDLGSAARLEIEVP